MWIDRFDVANFRNIEQAHLSFNPGFNLIVGANGSGKSSLLEALHCLSTGQSFRTNKSQPIIATGANESTIYGEIHQNEHTDRIGISKSLSHGTHLRLNGTTANSQALLALLTPITGTSPEAEDLIESGNKVRLAFLDWSLFHVEQNFRQTWREYRRILKQRNAALRNQSSQQLVTLWDAPLAELGEMIHQYRVALVHRLIPYIYESLFLLIPGQEIAFSYRQGWSRDITLKEALSMSLDSDMRMGFTHTGAHRADLILKISNKPLIERLSRGQRKMVIIAMRIAQAQDYCVVTGQTPLLYIDDLPAELDATSRRTVLEILKRLKMQTFLSATSVGELPFVNEIQHSLFHVEQGVVTNVV